VSIFEHTVQISLFVNGEKRCKDPYPGIFTQTPATFKYIRDMNDKKLCTMHSYYQNETVINQFDTVLIKPNLMINNNLE